MFVEKTVDELLFTGYEDKLITMGKMSGMDEDAPPFDRFGWFYMVRNYRISKQCIYFLILTYRFLQKRVKFMKYTDQPFETILNNFIFTIFKK